MMQPGKKQAIILVPSHHWNHEKTVTLSLFAHSGCGKNHQPTNSPTKTPNATLTIFFPTCCALYIPDRKMPPLQLLRLQPRYRLRRDEKNLIRGFQIPEWRQFPYTGNPVSPPTRRLFDYAHSWPLLLFEVQKKQAQV